MNETGVRMPQIPFWLLKKLYLFGIQEGYAGDIEEEYEEVLMHEGQIKAFLWIWYHALIAVPRTLQCHFFWGGSMFKNYLKITLRNMRRHKGFHFINMTGLAIGMACAIFILLYVEFELSYDNFHKDADRIYRIANEQVTSNGNRYYSAVAAIMGSAVQESFPQVESMGRLIRVEPKTVRNGNRVYIEEKLAFADRGVFDMFSVGFMKGNPKNALERPLTVVITESMAAKYFGEDDPLGKSLEVDGRNYEVTGVIVDSPENTHYKFGLLGSFVTLTLPNSGMPPWFAQWTTGAHAAHTYVKLLQGTDLNAFTVQINELAYENLKEELAQSGYEHHYFLQRLRDIHLHSQLRGEAEPPGSAQYILVLSIAGLLILCIACINFMNLSTARSANRSCEVGMRKVAGAARRQLILQFIGESMVMAVVTLGISLVLVGLTMNLFNDVLGTRFHFMELLRPKILIYLAVLVMLTGVVSGSYPAFFLSGFSPASVLRRTLSTGKKGAITRKILVTGQIAISIILIVGTLVIFQQINYMKNVPLGFDTEQKLIINLPDHELITNNYTTIKSELLRHPSVLGVTASSSVPGRRMFFWRMWPTGMRDQMSQPLNFLNVDYDFIDIYDMEIIAGRSFDRSFGSDLEGRGWVINEKAVQAYQWESPEEALGKEMMEDKTPIIGVVRDFHFKGLQNVVEPIGMSVWSEHFRCFTLKVEVQNLGGTISTIRDTYEKFFPGEIFDYFFLDDDFNRQYRFEEQIRVLFGVFTTLGIVIAVMGLIGLMAFVAAQRTREIGVRKVFGASVFELVLTLSKDFGKWILWANLIAWPAAWFAANAWLENFAYRIKLGPGIFIMSGLLVLFIAMMATGIQIIKAARANPVEALKYE